MWNLRGHNTILERPEEEDCEYSEENQRDDHNKKEKNKIERILEVVSENKPDFNFLNNNNKSKGKKKLLEKSNKESVVSENYTKNRSFEFTEKKYKEQSSSSLNNLSTGGMNNIAISYKLGNKNEIEEKSKSYSFNFLPIQDKNFNEDEFKEVELKVEEGKQNTEENFINYKQHSVGNNRNLNFIVNDHHVQKEVMSKEDLEKFNSVKSTTNTEKIRYLIIFKFIIDSTSDLKKPGIIFLQLT
jgi:hypothetical protein